MTRTKDPASRKPKFVEDIDHQKAKEIFTKYCIEEKNQKSAHDYLDAILAGIKTFEEDAGDENVRRSEREAVFKNLIDAIEEFDKTIEDLGRPQSRYRENPSRGFYIEKLGDRKFRKGMSKALTELFDPSYHILNNCRYSQLLDVQIGGPQYPELRPPLRSPEKRFTLRSEELYYEIENSIYSLSREILQCISHGIRPAFEELRDESSKRGRKVRDKLQETIILNILILYDQAFDEARALYVREGRDETLGFTREICRLLGCPNYCSAGIINNLEARVRKLRKNT